MCYFFDFDIKPEILYLQCHSFEMVSHSSKQSSASATESAIKTALAEATRKHNMEMNDIVDDYRKEIKELVSCSLFCCCEYND